ncbi:MAG: SWIM zinc finger domain-containing protein [Treponema sp.]|jgi:uncharacterized Zn finger protein|nr:SWIM zinc finger domain-containing protein [Treponema sp.]
MGKSKTAPGLVFFVQGSAPEPYQVIFYPEPFSISCTCQAGVSGIPCKHRIAILSGQNPGIVHGDLSFLPKIVEMTNCTNLFELLNLWEEGRKNKNNAKKRTDYAFKNYREERIRFLLKWVKTNRAVAKTLEALEAAIENEAENEKQIAETLKVISGVFVKPEISDTTKMAQEALEGE